MAVWTGGTGLVLTLAALPQLALEQRCRELRARGRRLEETLPRRIGSEEQREVLSLLCRVHELEVENTEMQSHALLRDSALRHRREAVRRLEQHRSLCDEIIQGQRQIIDGRAPPTSQAWGVVAGAEGPCRALIPPLPRTDYNLEIPRHLEELYEVYLRELEEGSLERATIMDRVASRALQVGSWVGSWVGRPKFMWGIPPIQPSSKRNCALSPLFSSPLLPFPLPLGTQSK